MATEQTTLAGGCFWCIESAFNSVKGIESAISGYMGGQTNNPTYETICTGTTGHAEVVQVTYEPSIISYREILEIFFSLHNPTQLNRQGNDIGTQYRTGVFFHTEEQKNIALDIINEIDKNKVWPDPIVTEVTEKSQFYMGEDLHQRYANRNPQNPYCQAVVSPKLAKFKQTFIDKLK